jgi:hypothetical protein
MATKNRTPHKVNQRILIIKEICKHQMRAQTQMSSRTKMASELRQWGQHHHTTKINLALQMLRQIQTRCNLIKAEFRDLNRRVRVNRHISGPMEVCQDRAQMRALSNGRGQEDCKERHHHHNQAALIKVGQAVEFREVQREARQAHQEVEHQLDRLLVASVDLEAAQRMQEVNLVQEHMEVAVDHLQIQILEVLVLVFLVASLLVCLEVRLTACLAPLLTVQVSAKSHSISVFPFNHKSIKTDLTAFTLKLVL